MTSLSLHNAILLLFTIHMCWLAAAEESLSVDDLRRLNPFEVIELRDFVRGKGKGTVSRVPLGNEAESEQEPAFVSENSAPAPNDTDVIDFGQQVWKMVPQIPSASAPASSLMSFSFLPVPNKNSTAHFSDNPPAKSVLKEHNNFKSRMELNNTRIDNVSKASKTSNEPTEEEYERLAEILQTFVNRRKVNVPKKEKAENNSNVAGNHNPLLLGAKTLENTSQQKEPDKMEANRNTLWPGLVEKTPKKFEKIALSVGTVGRDGNSFADTSSTSTISTANVDTIKEIKINKDYDDENNKMKRKLNDINNELMSMLRRNEEIISTPTTAVPLIYFPEHLRTTKAYVTVLREGIARQTNSGEYLFVASISLIRDSGKVILVDTGLSTDINGRTNMIQKLSKMNIAPPSVDYVITTHGHADHAGNTNEFPDSVHFQGTISHYRNKFNFTDLFENEQHQLTPNTYLLKTPGHTSDDISIIVHNTDKHGTVAISGDVFIAGEDIDYPLMWKPLAWDVKRQEASRRTLTCLADYIVPGHGKIFKVTAAMRNWASCRQS